MSCKEAVHNGISLKAYTPFDFELMKYSVTFFLTLMFVNKQVHFENHHHPKKNYQEHKSNQTFLAGA